MNNTPVAVGDIFSMPWGYDQTNVNYFQVTRLSKAGVFVREIGAMSVSGTKGFMSEQVTPVAGYFLPRSQWCGADNKETFRRLLKYNGYAFGPSFNFKGRYFARRVYANSSSYSSWYA